MEILPDKRRLGLFRKATLLLSISCMCWLAASPRLHAQQATQPTAAKAPSVYTLPADKLDKAIHLSRTRTALHFGNVAWTALILFVLLQAGTGARIHRWAVSVTSKAWLQGFLVAPLWVLVLELIGLPVSALSHLVQLHYGLSVQHWAGWLRDWGISMLLSLLFGAIVLSVLYALMRHSRKRWWLWFWLLTLPAEVFVTFAVPIFIDPLFNHFEPLAEHHPALVDQLERVVKRGGLEIPPSRMFLMDASAKFTGVNAYVTGFGASKRVVVWDTTAKLLSPDGILFIYGHEQGHYVLHHIVKGLIFTGVVTLAFYWIAYRLLLWIVRRDNQNVADWTSMGWILLLVVMLGFLAEPVGNAFSRMIEHQADVYGQEVIHGLVADPQQVAAEDFQQLGEIWLEDPAPNPFVVWWTYSHPPVSARMKFAAAYDPWAEGNQPRYFKK